MTGEVDLADGAEDGGRAASDTLLLDWATPEFRTVPTAEMRKGLRLERAFWRALGTIATWTGVKRHKLIAKVLEEASSQTLNGTSALRAFAMHTMQVELERVKALNESSYAVELLQQAPVPSFAVDRAKRVVRVNGEFNHFVRILFAESSDAAERKTLQLNLETPIARVFAELGDRGEARQYMLNVVVDGRVRRTRTRIVAVPPHEPKLLVGYILP